jgi:hypothetical protein
MRRANGIGAKRNRPPRDWRAAIEKRDAEGACRVCAAEERPMVGTRVEFAHLAGRIYDQERPCADCLGEGGIVNLDQPDETLLCPTCKGAGAVIWVDPDDGIPLCGPSTSTGTCHARQEAHELDLLPYLTNEEAAAAVRHLGLYRAYQDLSGSGRGPSPLEAARMREAA